MTMIKKGKGRGQTGQTRMNSSIG